MKEHKNKTNKLKNEKTQACKMSTFLTEKNNIKLSLHKCSDNTKIRDMMYETGGLDNWLPNIQEETESGRFQYAIVNSSEKLLGYLDYHVDWYSSCASRFGLISFDRGNPIIKTRSF